MSGSGYGISASTYGPTAPQAPSPGPGCTNSNEANSSTASGSANVGFLASASFSTSSLNSASKATCVPNFNTDMTVQNTLTKEFGFENNQIVATRNSLKSLSAITNNMVVNNVSSTTSKASQNITINQKMTIKINNCKGDLTISNIGQDIVIDASNSSNITVKQFDEAKADLANGIMAQLKNSVDTESVNKMEAAIKDQISNQQALKADNTASNDFKTTTEVQSGLPTPPQTETIPVNSAANMNQKVNQSSNLRQAVNMAQNFTNKLDIDRVIESHVNNAVTQNFTRDTLTILSQSIVTNQFLEIDVGNVGGKCTIDNITQSVRIALRQTLSQKMDIGTSIINTVSNTLGIVTDDQQTAKTFVQNGLTSESDMTNSQSADVTSKSEFKYTKEFTSGMGSCGSSGSSTSSSLSFYCFCCICCLILCGGISMPSFPQSEQSEDSKQSSENSDSTGSTTPTSPSPNPSSDSSSSNLTSSPEPGAPTGGFFSFF